MEEGYFQSTAFQPCVCCQTTNTQQRGVVKIPLIPLRKLSYRKVKWLFSNNSVGVCFDLESAWLLSLCPDVTWAAFMSCPATSVCPTALSSSLHLSIHHVVIHRPWSFSLCRVHYGEALKYTIREDLCWQWFPYQVYPMDGHVYIFWVFKFIVFI